MNTKTRPPKKEMRITIRIDGDTWAGLQREADKRDRPVAYLVRAAIFSFMAARPSSENSTPREDK